ncbi:MAG: hypothetical protein WA717_13670 [Methyloceanibacter sp.]
MIDLKKAIGAPNRTIKTNKMDSQQSIVDISSTFRSGKQTSGAEQ